jgi:hypothetical protein
VLWGIEVSWDRARVPSRPQVVGGGRGTGGGKAAEVTW